MRRAACLVGVGSPSIEVTRSPAKRWPSAGQFGTMPSMSTPVPCSFGYGVSYTTFAYRNPEVDKQSIAANESVTISVDIANTGRREGDEIAQLYITHNGIAGAPLRALQGFQRVHLAPGEQNRVSFRLRERDLSVVDQDGKRRIIPGKVNVWIGGGQPITVPGRPLPPGARAQFTITSEATLPD